jgi:spoIIIJ-associated protein
MLNKNDLEKIKKEAVEFFSKMNFEVEVQFPPQENETVFIEVKTEEPQILIGEGGQTLNEIQHLLKSILRKKITDPFFIDLDISNYKKKKTDYLREMAKTEADEVALIRREKLLPPMSAYERRIVHIELANRSDIVTESIGQEPERRIVIKPKM